MDFEAEADRLIGLDEAGRERELVVVALRLGEAAKQTWLYLRQHGLTGIRAGDVGSPEGPESILERVDA